MSLGQQNGIFFQNHPSVIPQQELDFRLNQRSQRNPHSRHPDNS